MWVHPCALVDAAFTQRDTLITLCFIERTSHYTHTHHRWTLSHSHTTPDEGYGILNTHVDTPHSLSMIGILRVHDITLAIDRTLTRGCIASLLSSASHLKLSFVTFKHTTSAHSEPWMEAPSLHHTSYLTLHVMLSSSLNSALSDSVSSVHLYQSSFTVIPPTIPSCTNLPLINSESSVFTHITANMKIPLSLASSTLQAPIDIWHQISPVSDVFEKSGAKFDQRWQRGYFLYGESTRNNSNFGCARFFLFPFDEEKTSLEMS